VTNYNRENTPVYDMSRYGVTPNGVDNTAIVQAVFNMLKVTGGTMVFPYGDWAFYLDVSGMTKPVFIEGNGSTFRPYTATPTQSCVVFCNNTGYTVSSAGTPLAQGSATAAGVPTFRNCIISAQLYSGGTVTGDVNCAVAYYGGQSGRFWQCQINAGKVAACYIWWGQYNEFWSTAFYNASLNATSAGLILDGYGTGTGSNEVELNRCVFQGNAIGLWVRGAFKTRVHQCNFQGNGTAYPYGVGAVAYGVICLDQDGSGLGCVAPDIDAGWFEVNYAPHIIEGPSGVCTSPRIRNCSFFGTTPYLCKIQTTYCSDWVITDCEQYGATMVCSISGGSNTAPKFTFHGNNFIPTTLSFPSASPFADLDMHFAGTYTGTLTGCTTSPTTTCKYSVDGNSFTIMVPTLNATSNVDTCTITGGPNVLNSASSAVCAVAGFIANGGDLTASAYVSGGVITFGIAGNTTAFNTSGSKGTTCANVILGTFY